MDPKLVQKIKLKVKIKISGVEEESSGDMV